MSPTQRYMELKLLEETRAREALRLYRPSPQQDPIHKCSASEIMVSGGKRSGKTVAIASAFASRVTGMDIYDIDGVKIESPWPKPSPDYPRLYWAIGWDLKHIGQTIHRILFQPGMGGQMRCIQDETTGLWRIWNRSNELDAKRVSESRLTEPLIPDRFINHDTWAWEDKRSNQFQSVELNNGAKLFAYPSSGVHAKMGDAVSGIWIDEDIMFPEHLREWQDRLTDEEGWFLWSVWPHMKNEALIGLIERAEREEFDEKPQIRKFQLIMTSNPYLTDKGKSQSIGRMETEEEVARRNRGDLLMDSLSMYHFEAPFHCIRKPDINRVEKLPAAKQMLLDMVMNNGFPREWTRYLSIDPSHTRTACHSWVVPPSEYMGHAFGQLAICEWEIIGRRWSAKMLAAAIFNQVGSRNYEAYIMDKRAGRQTSIGREAGATTFTVYGEEFREFGLISRQTGYGFMPGVDVPSTRFRAVRDLLAEQPGTGMPGMLFVEDRCIETKREFVKYRKKSDSRGEGLDMVLDEPANPRLFDAMASVEYFAAYIQQAFANDTAWVDPSNYASKGSSALQYANKIKARQKAREGEAGVVYLQAGDYTRSEFAS